MRIDVEIVVPVYNEQEALAASVHRLHRYLTEKFPLSWTITVADNASNDNTWGIACELAKELDCVRALHLEQKGGAARCGKRGCKAAASVVAYMDVDLSTDLDAFLPLVAPLLTGHSDVAIGSRLAPGARVVRGPKRELISRTYNVVLRTALGNTFPTHSAASRLSEPMLHASWSRWSKTTAGSSTQSCSWWPNAMGADPRSCR